VVDLNCLTSGCTGRSPAARAGEPYTLGDMRAVALGLALACAAPSYAGEESDPELTHLMVGAWRSPRHDYVYLADGTWWMGQARSERTRTTGHARPLVDQESSALSDSLPAGRGSSR
jgi:hypothetical protein